MSYRPVVAAVGLDALIAVNPGLSVADILALWRIPSPSARLH